MRSLSLLLSICMISCSAQAPSNDEVLDASINTAKEQTLSYEELKSSILSTRNKINKEYLSADSIGKDSIVKYSQEFLRNITQEVFTYWYKTQ